nr:hypothetical protein [Campylobacter lari]
FLINPNGVIITKTGTINANRFVASTSSMSDDDMWKFAKSTQAQGAAFSPVFKPNPKGGNVVNMGNINAKNVVLQGNKVLLDADTSWDDKMKNQTGIISANEINLQGNEVYVDVGNINGDQLQSLKIQGSNGNNFKGSMYLNASGYYYNPNSFKVFDKYTNTNNNFKVYKYVGIGSDVDWWHFAKGWNENKDGVFRNIASEYRLTNDIKFNGSNGQNYANYWVDLNGDGIKQDNEYTSMIVGYDNKNYFNKIFDGQGYTLKDINIEYIWEVTPSSGGIFGYLNNAVIKNLKIDNMKSREFFSEQSVNSTIDNIYITNIIPVDTSNYIFGNIDGGNITNIAVNGDFGYFTSGVKDAKLNNISINVNSFGNTNRAFEGFGTIYSGDFRNISIVFDEKSVYDDYFSGFAGIIESGNFENIYIKTSVVSSRFSISGFAREIHGGDFNNIFIDATFEASPYYGLMYAGGFAGEIYGGNFNNISIDFSGNLVSNRNSLHGDSCAGGFAGVIYGGNFDNISLDFKDGEIKAMGYEGTYAGGFSGYIKGDVAFNNIYMYFDNDFKINDNRNNSGKFFGAIDSSLNPVFNNIHIYHHESDLTNATADKNYWNDFNNGYVSDKINIHTYNNNNKDEVYKDFQEQVNTISKPMLPIFPQPPKPSEDINIPDVEEIKNETATLNTDDIISKDLLNQIISDLKDKFYVVDINTLNDLLKAYSKIDKNNPASKAEFLANYLLSKDEYPDNEKRLEIARSMIQSLDFLLAYTKNNTGDSKLTTDANNKYLAYQELSKIESEKTKSKSNELKDFINKKLKPLVESSNYALAQLKLIQEQLKTAIAKYNDYVKKINENPAIKNEETLNALKAEVDRLNQLSGELATTIVNNQIKLEAWQDKASTDSNKHFTIKGQFDNVALLILNLEKVTANGNENDDYEKISRQIADSQKQTPAFEYEEEETEEVEESAFK